MTQVYKGKGAVSGIAVGRVMNVEVRLESKLKEYCPGPNEAEALKYAEATGCIAEEIRQTVACAQAKGNMEQLAIMEAHQAILSDPVLESKVLQCIQESCPAPQAVLNACDEISALIASLEDPYMKERAIDIRDVGKRIAGMLLGSRIPDFSQGDVIICGDDIEPSVIANIPDGKVTGIIMGSGSMTSHAVIIAKSKGIATVVGMGDEIRRLAEGKELILDGKRGEVIVNADDAITEEYRKLLAKEQKAADYYMSLTEIPAVTKDGVSVTLAANIGNPKDIDTALKYGCEGVGLFRTEFVFMGKDAFPTEDEQFEAYRYVVEKCDGRLCVIRTMDIGGDKPLSYLNIGKEDNPFLGWRAIRICLERTEIFITQVKAILRAGVYGKVAIMLPMIISTDEILKSKILIRQAMEELKADEIVYAEDVQIGIMIETPAAAVMADELAKESDFFSIGTNDLVQYTLAVDRGNQKVSGLYSHYNPAVLRLISNVIKAAHENRIWVGMCGEMAGDPAATKLLVSMGIDELSMSAPSIPKVKETIRNTRIESEFVRQALAIADASQVELHLNGSAG